MKTNLKKIFNTEHVVNVTFGVLIVGTVLFWCGSLFVGDSYQTYKPHRYTAEAFDSELFIPEFEDGPAMPPAQHDVTANAPQQVLPAK